MAAKTQQHCLLVWSQFWLSVATVPCVRACCCCCCRQVLYRLYLAEKLKEPFRKGSRRPDAALLAAKDATRLEAEQVGLWVVRA